MTFVRGYAVASMDAHADELAELFAAAPDAFVATRDRLAAALATAGKKAESQALKKARRPTPSAWATNQVVRQARAAVDTFLDATDRLRRAQEALLAGRAAQAEYQMGLEELRKATAALSKAARAVLDGAGRADARQLSDRVLANVRAAGASAERRATLLTAQLTADLDAGETLFGGLLAAPASTSSSSPRDVAAPEPAVDRASSKQLQAEAKQRERARLLVEARAEESTALAAASRAARLVGPARAARDEHAARVAAAENALTEACEALRAADAELRRAEQDVVRDEKKSQAAAKRRETLERSD
jgi:hypothetical protein